MKHTEFTENTQRNETVDRSFFKINLSCIESEQCCGSAGPDLCLTDPDPALDPAIFVSDLQDANINIIVIFKFFCLLLFIGTLYIIFFPKIKNHKEVTKTVGINFFLLSGSVPLTNGSGRPKSIRRRIRIRNTLQVFSVPANNRTYTVLLCEKPRPLSQ